MPFKKKITQQEENEAIVKAAPKGQNIEVVFLKDYKHPEIAPGLDFKQDDRAVIDPNTFSAILLADPDAIAIWEDQSGAPSGDAGSEPDPGDTPEDLPVE